MPNLLTEYEDRKYQYYVKKWSKLLEGIEDPYIKTQTAVLLENQYRELKKMNLLKEETLSGTGMTSGLIDKFPTLAIPLVRRIFPGLIANEIATVQALDRPVGLAYSLRYVYDDTRGAITAGDEAYVPEGTPIEPQYAGTTTGEGYPTGEGELLGTGAPHDDIRKGSIKIVQTMVEAKTRKLAASWSQEAVDDIKKVHNVDLEKEIIDYLTYEIQAEIDREVILKMRNIAYTVDTYDFSTADGRWKEEKMKNLYMEILKYANIVGKTSRRGRANFMVATLQVITALQMASAFDMSTFLGNKAVSEIDNSFDYQKGIVYMGTISNGTIKVYLDLYTPEDYFLLGYKGKSHIDAGLIYCPYIPLMTMRAIDPNSFHPTIMLGSRYGIVDNLLDTDKYYANVTVQNLII